LRLEAVAGADSQEARYARAQAAASVRAAVGSLPPKFRIAVLLRYFDDLSYEEMARALRCSMGTVASRLSRGHKMLAERLKGMVE
jgi:RNA polymerase sigma-70 factor (ECF subfamily)